MEITIRSNENGGGPYNAYSSWQKYKTQTIVVPDELIEKIVALVVARIGKERPQLGS